MEGAASRHVGRRRRRCPPAGVREEGEGTSPRWKGDDPGSPDLDPTANDDPAYRFAGGPPSGLRSGGCWAGPPARLGEEKENSPLDPFSIYKNRKEMQDFSGLNTRVKFTQKYVKLSLYYSSISKNGLGIFGNNKSVSSF